MDYIYGELDVKNINYTGKNTSTANTTVDNIKRTIEVDVTDIPERYIDQINLIGNKVTAAESAITLCALDSAVVHNTGNETIGGYKTFINNITVGNVENNYLSIYDREGEYCLKKDGTCYLLPSIDSENTHLAVTEDLANFVIGPSSATDNTIALFDGTTGKVIKSASNITIDNNTVSILPVLSSTGKLGNATKKWGFIHTQNITIYNQINQNTNNKGLVVPDTTEWIDNKTIATLEDCGTKLYKHNLDFHYAENPIVIISTSSTPITPYMLYHNLWSNGFISMTVGGSIGLGFYFEEQYDEEKGGTYYIQHAYYQSTGEISEEPLGLSTETTITDTVTPL